jgi:hypothetical protein
MTRGVEPLFPFAYILETGVEPFHPLRFGRRMRSPRSEQSFTAAADLGERWVEPFLPPLVLTPATVEDIV